MMIIGGVLYLSKLLVTDEILNVEKILLYSP